MGRSITKPKRSKVKAGLDYIAQVHQVEDAPKNTMIVLDAKQIRALKAGETVHVDGKDPIIGPGEYIIDKIILWPGGGSCFLRGNRYCFAFNELAQMNIKGEALVNKDRHYC